MDLEQFFKNLLALGEILGTKPMSQMALELYAKALGSFSDTQIEEAIHRAALECKFMPKPAELVEMIQGRSASPEDKALLAWEELYNAIGQHGAWETVLFTDGRISRVVRLLGGWPAVCQWTEAEMQWRRKDFVEAYKAMPADCPQEQLPGLSAQVKAIGAPGQDKARVVVVGDGPVLIEEAKNERHLELVHSVATALGAKD